MGHFNDPWTNIFPQEDDFFDDDSNFNQLSAFSELLQLHVVEPPKKEKHQIKLPYHVMSMSMSCCCYSLGCGPPQDASDHQDDMKHFFNIYI